MTLKKLFRGGAFPLFAAVTAAVAFAALFIPLTRDFHYEFAALHALLFSIAGTVLSLGFYAHAAPEPGAKKVFFLRLLVLTALPLLAGIVKGISRDGCSLVSGILFYLLLVPPAVFVGVTVGRVSAILSGTYAVLIVVGFYLALILLPLLEFFFRENVFFYNPLIGYFPGTLYDTFAEPSLRLLWYRVITVLFFGVLFFLVPRFAEKRKARAILLSAWVFAAVVFFFISPFLGFSVTEHSLQKELRGVCESKHFVLYYPEGSVSRERARTILLMHEGYYSILEDFFRERPEKIVSFIFASREEKYRAIGAGNADLAKPWKGHIYLSLDTYQNTLKHEIAHVFAAEFGYSPFRVSHNANMLLLEGAAGAPEDAYDVYNTEFMAKLALQKKGGGDLIGELSSLGFFTSPSSYSYVLSGALCRFIIQNYGIMKFKRIYSEGFAAVLGDAGSARLQREFIDHIRAGQGGYSKAAEQFYFARGTVFEESCPRYVAGKMLDVAQRFAKKDYEGALRITDGLLQLSQSAEVVFSRAEALRKLKRHNKAISGLKFFLRENHQKASYYSTMLRLGDMYAAAGTADSARYYYGMLVSSRLQNKLSYLASFRLLLYEYGGDIRYLFAENKLPAFDIIAKNPGLNSRYESVSAMIALGTELKLDYSRVKEYIAGAMLRNFSTTNPAGYYEAAWFALQHRDYDFCMTALRQGILATGAETSGCLQELAELCTAMRRITLPGGKSPDGTSREGHLK